MKNIGISNEDLQKLYDYVAGKAEKPEFLERYTADINGRLKEMLLATSQMLLSQIPKKLEYYSMVQERLLDSSNIDNMNNDELSKILLNLSKDYQIIHDSILKTMSTLNNCDSLNSNYRDLLNRMLLMSDEKIQELKDKVDIK